MYNPPTYMTLNLLLSVLSEFTWPDSFTLEDDSGDGIIVHFPKCSLRFYESFESDMNLYFMPEDTKIDFDIPINYALAFYFREEAKKNDGFQEPELTNFFSPSASLEKVKNGIRDICIILQSYFLEVIKTGNFKWVDIYTKRLNQWMEENRHEMKK